MRKKKVLKIFDLYNYYANLRCSDWKLFAVKSRVGFRGSSKTPAAAGLWVFIPQCYLIIILRHSSRRSSRGEWPESDQNCAWGSGSIGRHITHRRSYSIGMFGLWDFIVLYRENSDLFCSQIRKFCDLCLNKSCIKTTAAF